MDYLNSRGISTDPHKIVSGKIFVDLSSGRSKNKVYDAYRNGASLIFTTKSITDPDLPVIKVKNVNQTLMQLLGTYYGRIQEKMKLIAIGGSSQKEVVSDMLNNIFCYGLDSFKDTDVGELRTFKECKDLEAIYTKMSALSAVGVDKLPFAIDFNEETSQVIAKLDIDFGILTGFGGCNLSEYTSKELSYTMELFSRVPENKPILINIDEPLSLDFVSKNKSALLITYGLNKKSAVTATSINTDDKMEFTYCLQRTMLTCSGNKVEPFEIPIKLNTLGEESLYNAMAAITCAIYYDYDIDHIKRALSTYNGAKRRCQTVYKGRFTVIDNDCSSLSDLETAFKTIQAMNFRKLYPFVTISKEQNPKTHDKKMKILSEWAHVLGCEELILKKDSTLQRGSVEKKYEKHFGEEGLGSKTFVTLSSAVDYLMQKAEANDLILLLGGDEMEEAAETIKKAYLYN